LIKIVKNPGNGRLNNLNDPNRPHCVKTVPCFGIIYCLEIFRLTCKTKTALPVRDHFPFTGTDL